MATAKEGSCNSRASLTHFATVTVGKQTSNGSTCFAVLSSDVNNEQNCLLGTEAGLYLVNIARPDRVESVTGTVSQNAEVASVRFSSVHEGLVAVGRKVHNLDLRTPYNHIVTFEDNTDDVNDVAMSQDGIYVGAADDSGEIQIYDIRNRKLYKTLRKGHKNICSRVSFMKIDNYDSHVVTAGLDCQLVLWDYSKPKAVYLHNVQDSLASCGDSSVYMFNPPMVNALDLLNLDTVVCGLGNGSMEFIFADSTKKLNSFCICEAHASTGVTSICTFDMANIFISGGNDCEIKIWDSTEALQNRDVIQRAKKKKKKKTPSRSICLSPLYCQTNESKINWISPLGNTDHLSFLVADQTNIVKFYNVEL